MNNSVKKKSFEEIIKPIEFYLRRVDEITVEKLKTGVPMIDDAALHLFAVGGKRIRASLVILSAGLTGEITEKTLELAAAAEIVHAATLIHDDIIDQSILRRGNIAVPAKWGYKVSVLAGDFMYTVSLDIAVASGNPKIFPVIVSATRDMVKGELYQLQYSDIHLINRNHYLKIIELKTAKFMAACAELGALASGADENITRALYDFGLNLGFGFQIIDDALDLAEESESTGKDSGNDLLDGKITLPVIYHIEQLANPFKEMFILNIKNLTKGELNSMLQDIRSSGGIQLACDEASEYIDKARSAIGSFPETEFRNIMHEIADFIIYRNH